MKPTTLCAFLIPWAFSQAVGAVEMVVTVKPALVLRDIPDLSRGKILDKIPFGKTVRILAQDGPETTALGLKGRWYRVSYGNKEGWGFGPFFGLPGSDSWYEIIEGMAHQRKADTCLALKEAHFPGFFSGGCLRAPCNQGCGNLTLEPGGKVLFVGSCDGNTEQSTGTWKKQGKTVTIEYTAGGITPEEACTYQQEDPSCIPKQEAENRKMCGKTRGCTKKEKLQLRMTRDNQFQLGGEQVCVYP